MSSTSMKPHTTWARTATDDLTTENIPKLLKPILDDVWVTAACLDRSTEVNDSDIQRVLLTSALQRTQIAVESAKEALNAGNKRGEGGQGATLEKHWTAVPSDLQLCQLRTKLLHKLDKLNTWVKICSSEAEVEGVEDDDPWAEASSQDISNSAHEPSVSLSDFLGNPIFQSAINFANKAEYSSIALLYKYHFEELWPSRFAILERVPAYEHPLLWKDILPALDSTGIKENLPTHEPSRAEPDWVETYPVNEVLLKFEDFTPLQDSAGAKKRSDVLSSDELTSWYKSRVTHIIDSTGMIDIALATIQHGATNGIRGLDELGEDLSLLSRLIYDAPQASDIFSSQEDWTLERWTSMQPSEVVSAYLKHCTPENVAHNISKLVLPYLFVTESRAERRGDPDPDLPNRLLYEFLLTAPLEIATAVFEASKPTITPAQRLIKSDEDLVRLALACIYGSNTRTEWATMSRIFECLPAWDVLGDVDDDDADAAETTVASLGSFVTPTTDKPICTALDLLIFFRPLPKSSLSRALDILDVHLESGEILTRWNVPALPQWFLQSANDAAEQRAWANRMSRRAGFSDIQMNGKEDWEWLYADMIKLTGTGEGNLKGAFGLLTSYDVSKIFFGGLMASGNFEIAKEMLTNGLELKAQDVEDICLTASRELYDNSSSANYKFGDMKLAFDCLSVPKSSHAIIKEKEFIEATSRIGSYNVMSRPGMPISPIEIRLTKDRLTLVSRVLASNADAYKHVDLIIDLVHKLGFRDNVVAEVKTLAMLADAALLADDFQRTLETSQKMVNTVHALRQNRGINDALALEASEVCWIACFQLGRHPEFGDLGKKLSLVGRALELCPPEKIHEILAIWTRLDDEDIEERKARMAARKSGIIQPYLKSPLSDMSSPVMSLANRLQGLHLPSLPGSPLANTEEAAAMASRAFSRVSANFLRGRDQSPVLSDGTRSGSHERIRKRDEASRVLQKGIGWLIGADE